MRYLWKALIANSFNLYCVLARSDGLFACLGNRADVSDNSCISGEKTYRDVPGDPFDYIGACQGNQANIGKECCWGFMSCAENTGEITGPSSW